MHGIFISNHRMQQQWDKRDQDNQYNKIFSDPVMFLFGYISCFWRLYLLFSPIVFQKLSAERQHA